MGITFNTNLSALTAQRYLGVSSDKTASSLAKLSSGSRVPTAKDDAAGLAVGSRLRAETASLTQASNNASQAVSLLQIADGALSTVGDILTRAKALAVQAASGQLGNSERALLNQEFVALRSEIDRVAQNTNFNGTTLLNGGDRVATVTESQSGFLQGRGLSIITNTALTGDDDTFRVSYSFTNATITGGNAADERDSGILTVTNLTTGATQSIDVAPLIQAASAASGTLDTIGEGALGDLDLTAALAAGTTVDANFNALGVTIRIDRNFNPLNNLNVGALTTTFRVNTGTPTFPTATTTFQSGARLTGTQLAALSTLNSTTGVLSIATTVTTNSATVDATAGLQFSRDGIVWGASLTTQATNTTSSGFYVRANGQTNALAFVGYNGTAAAGSGFIDIDISGILRVQEATSAQKSFTFKVGTGVSVNDDVGFTLNGITTSALNLSGSTVDTAVNATSAITALDLAITTVASRRADIGAAQSRLDFASANIATAIENISAARSALLDVDVSAEITEFTSQQVLVQAGVSLLAQANQQPSLLLRLLQ